MALKTDSGLLIGKKEILAYLKITEDTFRAFLQMGMPTANINNRYYAHMENLELWVKAMTRQQGRQIDENAE